VPASRSAFGQGLAGYTVVRNTGPGPVTIEERLARWEQGNEQWHLADPGGPHRRWSSSAVRPSPGRAAGAGVRVLPAVVGDVRGPTGPELPANADFEDHAEHEYAYLVDEHPEWDPPADDTFSTDFGTYDSLADLFRQIGYDERLHTEESEHRMGSARFR